MDSLDLGDDFRVLNDLGVRHRLAGRYAEAEAALRRAVALSNHVFPATALGNLYRELGRLPEAETAFRDALCRAPDHAPAQTGLGLVLLALGRYYEAWPMHEARRRLPRGTKLPIGPEWQGEPVAGKRIVLWPEQGLGDQIMGARFAVELRERGAEVTVVCSPVLRRLFSSLGVTIVTQGPATALPRQDYAVLTLSAPARLGTTLDRLPPPGPFQAVARSRGGIGVAWRGNAAHEYDRHRSLPPEAARRLLALPGAMSLHPEDTGARDFQDTADIVAGLDLVISVDTSCAHLAASLGKPTWILLSSLGLDWRWLTDRIDSPWYPSARLIRYPGADWQLALDEIEARLPTITRRR